jgi:hypothetical protein
MARRASTQSLNSTVHTSTESLISTTHASAESLETTVQVIVLILFRSDRDGVSTVRNSR